MTLIKNTQVVQHLGLAHANAAGALSMLREAGTPGGISDAHAFSIVATRTKAAAANAAQALAGADALGRDNLLEAATHRYARHAARDLTAAASAVQRAAGSADALSILTKSLEQGSIASRIGHERGLVSLANPVARSLPTSGSGSGASTGTGGPIDVDGVQVDELGNPVRDAGGWVGPDGDSFGGLV